MAKQDYIFRYLTIIKKLRRSKQGSFEEIRDYLHNESEFQDRPFSISNRTFLRDLNEIRDLFKIDIQYGGICDFGFLLEPDPTYLGKKPFRTYLGPVYHGGISDHLPVRIRISSNY